MDSSITFRILLINQKCYFGTREEYVPTYVRLFVMFVILFVTFVITFVNFYDRTQNQGGQELKIE